VEHPVFTIAGHRGVLAHEPENSLKSFARAEEAGADEIELDVRVTKDGVPVVVHDPTLQRIAADPTQAAAAAPILDATLADLRAILLDSGRPLLTLAEAYEATTITIQAEIKDPASVYEVAEFYTRRPQDAARTVFTSFDFGPLAALAVLLPHVPRGIIVPDYASAEAFPGGVESLLQRTGSSIFHCGWNGLTSDVVETMHRAGLGVRAWPVRDREDMVRAVRLGVDGITSDDPALARSWYREAIRAAGLDRIRHAQSSSTR
jgi:glycerophosphoryl diester phosphodiesterase